MEGISATQITKGIKFKRVWGELESKKCFKRQPVTKYLRLTVDFM